jgi:hypothetical protein
MDNVRERKNNVSLVFMSLFVELRATKEHISAKLNGRPPYDFASRCQNFLTSYLYSEIAIMNDTGFERRRTATYRYRGDWPEAAEEAQT